MIVKCPQCATGYNIPEHLIGDKPRKMRCSRCSNTFTITRRQESAPVGYQEFTGKQELPAEFAFLREASKPPEPQPPVSAQPPLAQLTPSTAPAGLYKSVMDGADAQVETIPLEPPVISGPDPSLVSPQEHPSPEPNGVPEPVGVGPDASPEAAPPPEQPPRQSAFAPRRDTSNSLEIFGTQSAWEMEAPLELGGFAIPSETPVSGGGQALGKFVFVLIVALVGLLIFVAYRNGWSISVPDLGTQIAFAFSGETLEELPAEVADLDATITTHSVIVSNDNHTYIVAGGEILNNNASGRQNIIVRGRIKDATGEIRTETRVPCGRAMDDDALKATKAEDISSYYRSGGQLYNCQISAGASTVFQVIFEDVPADYNSTFKTEVTAVAAKIRD